MGIAERREREKEALRMRIVEAARDIVSDRGLDALSMRTIAERIEYSPATIYLYFKDKNELLGEVTRAGREVLGEHLEIELKRLKPNPDMAQQHRALGRAYVNFALENTAYFRVMFELPTAPNVCSMGDHLSRCPGMVGPRLWESTEPGTRGEVICPRSDLSPPSLVAWGVVHGLTSLYLSGHLARDVESHAEFKELVEKAMDSLGTVVPETSAKGGS